MPDTGSDISPPAASSVEPPRTRSGRFTTMLAVLALATALYALLRLDATRDRLDQIGDVARTLEAERSVLRTQLESLAARERQARRALARRLEPLERVPQRLEELDLSVEELRGRAMGPERAWSRAEALFLLELAQHRLALDRDVATAIVALESADLRLASLRDASFTGVRQQLARELQALHAVRVPDLTGVLARLASAEEQAAHAPLKGIVAVGREQREHALAPGGAWQRAWALVRSALADLIVVREVDERAGRVVTAEQADLRRQHLQLLLFAARTAVARRDGGAYRSTLAHARQWLGEFFDLSSPVTQTILAEVQALEPVDIDPQLPDVSGSAQALRQLLPAGGRSG